MEPVTKTPAWPCRCHRIARRLVHVSREWVGRTVISRLFAFWSFAEAHHWRIISRCRDPVEEYYFFGLRPPEYGTFVS